MDFDGLDATYWRGQAERVEAIRKRIKYGNAAMTALGRVVPQDDDLAIGSGRRLPLTILFTDISGFSARRSWTEEEQANNLRMLNLYFTEMIRIIEDYGGTVEKNTGDGLMAYFEDSQEEYGADNSTKRALACALTMFAANEKLILPILKASDIAPIEFRVSIEHGPVTIARIGAPRRFSSNAAIGNAANFASKMLSHIKPNNVGLGHAAKARLPTAWQTDYCVLADVVTNWTFTSNSAPYPLYIYNGRWVLPA